MGVSSLSMEAADLQLRGSGPMWWRRVAFRVFALVGAVLLFSTTCSAIYGTSIPTPARAEEQDASGGGDAAHDMPKRVIAPYGFCPAQPSVVSKPLRWGSNPSTADHICCNQHRFAEYSGYWLTTSFPQTLPEGETITFYDVASSLPLFRAPVGRSYADFHKESTMHGWPSFRDAETIW